MNKSDESFAYESCQVHLQVFRGELASDFANWTRIPDSVLALEVRAWRSMRKPEAESGFAFRLAEGMRQIGLANVVSRMTAGLANEASYRKFREAVDREIQGAAAEQLRDERRASRLRKGFPWRAVVDEVLSSCSTWKLSQFDQRVAVLLRTHRSGVCHLRMGELGTTGAGFAHICLCREETDRPFAERIGIHGILREVRLWDGILERTQAAIGAEIVQHLACFESVWMQ